jgi:hypothetical protein
MPNGRADFCPGIAGLTKIIPIELVRHDHATLGATASLERNRPNDYRGNDQPRDNPDLNGFYGQVVSPPQENGFVARANPEAR